MKRWFKRRDDPGEPPKRPGSAPPRAPARRPATRIPDWRSYDEVAAEYQRTHAPYTAAIASELMSLGEISSGARILDLGCGTGDALPAASAAVGEPGIAAGIDPAIGMLRLAPVPRVAAAEVINLPFRDDTFDVIMANFSLAYFAKLDTALFDVRRVLRPGGRLVASAWGADEDDLSRTWRLAVEEAIGRDILKAGLRDETPWAERLSEPRSFEGTIRDAGFRPVRIERRRFRFEIPREDYISGHEIEASGRYARAMLGETLWPPFRERIRATFAERFPEQLIDFRDVLLAIATNPR